MLEKLNQIDLFIESGPYPFDTCLAHEASIFICIITTAAVEQTPIVPNDQIAWLPGMCVNAARFSRATQKLFK